MPGWEEQALSMGNMHSSFKGFLGLGFRVSLFVSSVFCDTELW